MKTKLLLLFLVLLTSFVAFSQEIRTSQPDSLIKIVPDAWGRHFFYTVDGEVQSPYDIRMRLLSYDPSAVEYKAGRKDIAWGIGLSSASGIAGFVGGTLFINNSINSTKLDPSGYGFIHTRPDQTAAYLLTGAAVGMLTVAIIDLVKGSAHLKKSFWLYNIRFQ